MLFSFFAVFLQSATAEELTVLKPKLGGVQDVSKKNIARWDQNFKDMGEGKEIRKEDYADGFDETMEGGIG